MGSLATDNGYEQGALPEDFDARVKTSVDRVIAIDPGTTESAVCIYDEVTNLFGAKILPNRELLDWLRGERRHTLAIEMVASYGMPVGREVFETVLWTGRFIEAHGGEHRLVYRKEVKLHLCASLRANDASIRQSLVDRFGGKGTKKAPGRLHGFVGDMYSALAVALTTLETQPTIDTPGGPHGTLPSIR